MSESGTPSAFPGSAFPGSAFPGSAFPGSASLGLSSSAGLPAFPELPDCGGPHAPFAVPLPVLVRTCRQRLTALLAEADPAAAAWVEQVRAARPDTPTVVVVGETGRGKSSLVNALLATPGLSPVNAVAPAASYLVLRHGPDWAATAHYPGAPSVEVALSELASWMSADAEAPSRYAEVAAPVPLLQQLTLIDTPGVGGLGDAYGELAREAAVAATALLFVLDAAAPLTRGELAFLAGLSDQVETVLFALTKIDLHRGWRAVLDADRELLLRHVPRFSGAMLHPVSARLAEQAATAPTEEIVAVLREQSGITALRSALQHQVSGRVAMLGEANTLRALSTALDGLIGRLQAQQRALESGDAEACALRARRAQLSAARRAPGRQWQVRLRAEIQRVRVESTHEVADRIRSAHTQLRAAIFAADRVGLANLPHRVDATLQMVADQVSTSLAARVAGVVDTVLGELFLPAELAAVRAALLRGDQPPVVLSPPDPRPGTAEDKLLVAIGFSGGVGLGRLAVLPLAAWGAPAGLLVLPVSLAVGLSAGWWMARTRRHTADKAHLQQWLSDVFAQVRATLEQTVAGQLIDAEQQLTSALDDALVRRIAAIEEELREVDRGLQLNATQRTRALAAAQARLTQVSAGRTRLDTLLARLRELRDRPEPPSAPSPPGLP